MHSKMYILIKDWIDPGHAVNSCAHAGAMIESNFPRKVQVISDEKPHPKPVGYIDDPVMKDWYDNSFRKVTCRVTEKEFEKAKKYDDWFVVTEMAFANDNYPNDEVVLVFKPRVEWPRFFNFLKLWK